MGRLELFAVVLLVTLTPSHAGAAPGGIPTPALGSNFDALPAPESTPPYFEKGGWIVFTVPVAGDVLYACPPLARADVDCTPVVLPIRSVGSVLEPWFIDDSSGAAWFKVSVPPMGDFLLGCFEPQTSPHCTLADIEARPPLAALERLGNAGDAGGGVGGLPKLPALPGASPPPSNSTAATDGCGDALGCRNTPMFWMTASLPSPGPVTLYACGGLEREPACRVAVSGLDLIKAEGFGLEKLSKVRARSGGLGIAIGGVAAGSVAELAGLREGDVVTTAAGFELFFPAHLQGLLSQVPIGDSIRLEVEGKGLVKLTRRPRG